MSEIKLFEKEEFGKVRVVMIGNDPWFYGTDVAKALGYERPNDAVNAHCKKINKFSYGDSPQGATPYNIIPESDVYRLVMRSNLPNAEKFQDWVVEEVLPSIRKTGQYGGIPDFTDPVAAARAWADAMEAKRNLEQRNEQLVNTVTDLATVTTALRDALGNSIDWKSVTAIPWLREYFADASTRTCSIIGKFLTMLSEFRGYTVRDVPDSKWGSVHAYHKDMVDEFRRLLDERPDFMVELRKKQN
jgi:prophage antirepressor-like protein